MVDDVAGRWFATFQPSIVEAYRRGGVEEYEPKRPEQVKDAYERFFLQ